MSIKPSVNDIQVGDLVEGTSMHNFGLIGFVIEFSPNEPSEYKVHYLVSKRYDGQGYYSIYERFYDIKKIS